MSQYTKELALKKRKINVGNEVPLFTKDEKVNIEDA